MYHSFDFQNVLAASTRAAWQLDDVLPPGAGFDFGRSFMPEAIARTAAAHCLTPAEQRTLNHVRAHEYLSMFGLVEEFILPFVMDQARTQLGGDDFRTRALLNFASEEAKHIQLFKRFHSVFTAGFGTPCAVIGPPEAIAEAVLGHDPLAVALLVLHIEWMSQRHYVECVHDNGDIEPLFRSLLRNHWIEEAQHAKLDTLMVEGLAAERDAAGIARGVDGYLALGAFLDEGLRSQTEMNLAALEAATGRMLPADERAALAAAQHQALRWTYIGSGMTHPNFLATLARISPEGRARIDAVAPAFC